MRVEMALVKRISPSRRQLGLTLLELILVLLIIGLGLAVVAPALGTKVSTGRARLAARQIRAAMEYQRVQAVRSGKERVLIVDPDQNNYWIGEEEGIVSVPPEDGLLRAKGRWMDEDGKVAFRFYPDGMTSGGEVLVEKRQGVSFVHYVIRLDPLLGSATVAEVRPQ
jgi:type II secretory pathway pseudopilin PulG